MKRDLIAAVASLVFAGAAYGQQKTITVDDIGASYEWGKYETFDGRKQDLYVFYPPGKAKGANRPAVVCIHGGGWVGGKPDFFFPHCQYFARRGAVAFSVQYRLVGQRGIEAFDGVETCLADCKAALASIRRNAGKYGIDPDKIAVIGDSAGGHLAACLATIDGVGEPAGGAGVSVMANAAICCNPCIDMTLPLVMNIFAIKGVEKDGKTEYPAEAIARAKHYSPIEYLKPGQPPVMVIHGTEDVTIPVEQAHRFADAEKKIGNRCDLVILEGEKHAFVIVGIGTEKTIVRALRESDMFLASLGFLEGPPIIDMSH